MTNQEKDAPAGNAKECFSCGVNSDDRVLLTCVYHDQQRYVCVTCLPRLIHGSHGH